MPFPIQRHRRLRNNHLLLDLVAETQISIHDFITPLFVMDGKNLTEEISSMPGYYRYSLDLLIERINVLYQKGLRCYLLFGKIDPTNKDNDGTAALNKNGIIPKSIKAIKDKFPDCVLMADAALDPFSSYGHDGIVADGKIVNDATNNVLSRVGVLYANCGADFIAPSDMMDGRILAIRNALDEEDFKDVGIMSYSAKYASCFYGPFRDALDSAPGMGDKTGYQMDPRNSKEAVKEILSDVEEGADILMVKPALAYLDVIAKVSVNTNLPIAAYQVSGEYSMIKAAAMQGCLNENDAIKETIIAIKRAGSSLIASYFSEQALDLFQL